MPTPKSIVQKISDEGWKYALTLAFAAVGAWVWGVLKTFTGDLALPPIMIVFGAVVIFALVLLCWSQLQQMMDRSRHALLSQASPGLVLTNLLHWMNAFGIGNQKQDARTGEDFRYRITQRAGGVVEVAKPTGVPWIVCDATIEVTRAQLDTLGPSAGIIHREMELEFGRLPHVEYTLDWLEKGAFKFTIKSYMRFSPGADSLDYLMMVDSVNRAVRSGRALMERAQYVTKLGSANQGKRA